MEFCWACALLVTVVVLLVAWKFRPNPVLGDLREKYVFITGCDTGFGNILACRLDKDGVHVFAACLTEEGARTLNENTSGRTKTFILDVTSQVQLNEAVEMVKRNIPDDRGLWGLVNNAGVSHPGLIDMQTIEQMKRVVDINMWGVVMATKAFLPLLKKSQGRVVNMASSLGRVSFPTTSAYCMSKNGVRVFSDVARLELGVWGISVHAIEPGFFKTNICDSNIIRAAMKAQWDNLDQETKDSYGQEYYNKINGSAKAELDRLLSTNLDLVINAMYHALLASRPKDHYPVGWDMQLVYRWMGLMPACITDRIIKTIIPICTIKPAKAP